MSATKWQDLVVSNEGGVWGTLGELVNTDPERVGNAKVENGRIVEWSGFFLSAPGEEPDWNTPKGEVDWAGFEPVSPNPHTDYVTVDHIPTAADALSQSVVIGHFDYPKWSDYTDETEYEESCCDREIVAKNLAIAALNDAGIDTTDIEIRTSEFTPGEIRVYGWPETMASNVCHKLGISANELNSLFTNCPVDGAAGTSVARELRERFGLNEDEDDLSVALQEKGVITQEEAAWLRED